MHYTFDEVRVALHAEWGLSLRRGGEMTDLGHDGRWDTAYSKTGYVVGGALPGRGHGYKRYRSLAAIVRGCRLAKFMESHRG